MNTPTVEPIVSRQPSFLLPVTAVVLITTLSWALGIGWVRWFPFGAIPVSALLLYIAADCWLFQRHIEGQWDELTKELQEASAIKVIKRNKLHTLSAAMLLLLQSVLLLTH